MKIVVAPTAFKESLTAAEAAACMARGFRSVFPDVTIIEAPLGDGGPGTMEALVEATAGLKREVRVRDPLGEPVTARYGIIGDGETAIIEMAEAAGLELIPPDRRNPLETSTFGVGEMFKDAMEQGVTHIVVALGGSGTVDGGTGLARALGMRFLDEQGNELPEGGGALRNLAAIDKEKFLPDLERLTVEGACDVTNPLCGPDGAAHVFAPQKGATPEMVEQLEEGLARLDVIVSRDLGVDVGKVTGAGAAGGFGAGLVGFLRARLRSGIELVVEVMDLETHISDADLVVTGEGRLDGQTAMGKAPAGVAETAKKHRVPVAAICGSVTDDAETVLGNLMDTITPIAPPTASLQESLQNAAEWTESTARRLALEMKESGTTP